MAFRKVRKPQHDTKERRAQQGIKLTTQDFVRRGLRLVEGSGKSLADAIFGQFIDKQPQHEESWVPQVRSTDKSGDPYCYRPQSGSRRGLKSRRRSTRLPVVLRASTCGREILRPRGQRRLRSLHAAGGALS